MEFILCSRHRNVEQPPFFFDLFALTRGVFVREIAVATLEYVDVVPSLTLGRVNSRQDQKVLIERCGIGDVRGGTRWVERQFAQKPLPRGELRCCTL